MELAEPRAFDSDHLMALEGSAWRSLGIRHDGQPDAFLLVAVPEYVRA